jgi:signal transduction histidine kinase
MKESESFFYLAAHDLRAPLMSVKGLLNLIKIDPEKKNMEQYFKLLERSVEKMNQSITELISYSMGTKIKIVPEEVNLRTVAEDAVQSLRFIDGEKIRIELFIEQNLVFISDYRILFGIFNNIISNAIRYRDPDKSSFLKISATGNNEDIEISFEDNGVGMSPQTKARIFDKFFLANPEQGGTGLGLYMVKNAVEKLDGRILVESKLGTGTTFTIQIPLLIKKDE